MVQCNCNVCIAQRNKPVVFVGLDTPKCCAEVIFDFGPRACRAVAAAIHAHGFTRRDIADAMEELLWEEV